MLRGENGGLDAPSMVGEIGGKLGEDGVEVVELEVLIFPRKLHPDLLHLLGPRAIPWRQPAIPCFDDEQFRMFF